jgi:hypothetical protein
MSQMEIWVYRDALGRVILHKENDGYAYLRRGAEAREWVLTLRDGEVIAEERGVSMTEDAKAEAKKLLSE